MILCTSPLRRRSLSLLCTPLRRTSPAPRAFIDGGREAEPLLRFFLFGTHLLPAGERNLPRAVTPVGQFNLRLIGRSIYFSLTLDTSEGFAPTPGGKVLRVAFVRPKGTFCFLGVTFSPRLGLAPLPLNVPRLRS